jgi:beta-galactosidase
MPQWLPRIGLQWQLPKASANMKWFGRGPFETYPDRKTGAKIDIYTSTVDEEYVPYLIPQDHGNKTDVYWVELSNDHGAGLRFESYQTFNFTAHRYATKHLERAMYPFQLRPDEIIYLNIDPEVTGVGDTSKSTLTKYRVTPGNVEFSFSIEPL